MKAVQLLVNSVLPEDMRNYGNKYDVKDMNKILYAVAQKHPEKFAEVEKQLSDFGRKASYLQGATITLKDLEPVVDKKELFSAMNAEIKALPKNKDFVKNRRAIFNRYNDLLSKTVNERALANRNNIAMAVLSGARGKVPQLKAMIGSPWQFSDYKGEPIDVIAKNSFAEGIDPTTFLASTYGARSSVISTKCIDSETLTRMADLSVKKIKDIKVGEYVLGADKEGRVFPVKVLNVFDQGEKDCYTYRFKFSNGELEQTEVTCTEAHKFLMVSAREYNRKRSLYSRGNGPAPTPWDRHNKEVMPVGRMRRASRCSDYNPLYPQGGYTGDKDEPWARIIGLLVGDGNLTQGGRAMLSCADSILIDDITPELENLGHRIKKVGGDNYSWSITQLNYNAGDNKSIVPGTQGFVRGRLNPRNQMLQDYGLLGHYAWEKRLPLGWQTWSRASMVDLIAGIFAADGSVYSTVGCSGRAQVSVTIAVTSDALIKDLKLALSVYFGITGREERPVLIGGFGSSSEERVHPLYTLEISRAEDVLKFRDIFRDRVPGVKKYTLDAECGKIVIKQLNPYAKHMFQSKEHVGPRHCYDIEVDHPDHLFVLANGLITSNSATAKGGDLAKQFASTSVDITVREEDCHTNNGISLPVDDKSLVGRALAMDMKGHKAGTFITSDILADLRKKGAKNVVARSALTCKAHGGVCAHCIGKFYNGGKLAKVGDAVGLMSSTAVSEPITQMALCLSADTEVVTKDAIVKKISAIMPGEEVLGADIDGNTQWVSVLDVHAQGVKECNLYTFSIAGDHRTVVCTKDHKFLTPEGAILPVEYADAVVLLDGVAEKVGEEHAGEVVCYDLTVDHPDHLFALANGLIVSNSAKHTAGMTAGKKTYAGIPVITQFTQSPEKYKDKAVVSEVDGKVEKIEDADQGGKYVTVAGKRHYIQTGHEPEVKVGDTVEAGDFLSEGLPDVEDVVRLKGLGAGRKLYADRLNQILSDSGAPSDPRNTEVLARGALRHVRVTSPEGFGNYLPDDLIDYDAVSDTYKMPEDTKAASPGDVIGKYLQQPFMHYTIGTRLTPKVAKDLSDNGYDRVFVADTKPAFEPEMVRLRSSSQQTRDWLASLGTSYLTQQLNESATRGDDTNVLHNPDYRPRIAYGVGFGKDVRTTGEF